MNKIKWVSLFFRVFFQITFVALILAQIIGWVVAPTQGGFFNVIPVSYQDLIFNISLQSKLAGFFVSSILLAIKLAVLYSLIKLFQGYENQEFFSLNNVKYIRNAGYALLLFEIIKPIIDLILGYILTAGNPPGYHLGIITFDDANIGVIFIALLIILNFWIMSEGCKLKEEQQLII